MENLFLNAIGTEETSKFNIISQNKAFALKLIDDLSKVYLFYKNVINNNNGVRIDITKIGHKLNTFYFISDERGVFFRGKILGYRESKQFISLGFILEKYPLSTADNGFINGGHGHGYIDINIPLNENDIDLMSKLKDITILFNKENFPKNF